MTSSEPNGECRVRRRAENNEANCESEPSRRSLIAGLPQSRLVTWYDGRESRRMRDLCQRPFLPLLRSQKAATLWW